MAANSTLLAIQCGAGVPVPRSHLRRNLAPKEHKIATMAANPAMQYEACFLASSIPRQLHRSSVIPKRNNTIVAAYPGLKVEVVPGIPEYTKGELHNFSGADLKLDDKIFWGGSRSVTLPKKIWDGETGKFEQRAGSGGSIGGLEYVFPEDEYKLIVAWSNAKDDLNKVYTQILQEDADWVQIKESLDKSGHRCIFDGQEHDIPYSSSVEIDKTSPTPTLRATVTPGCPFLPPFPQIIHKAALISGGSAEDGRTPGSGGDAAQPEALQAEPQAVTT